MNGSLRRRLALSAVLPLIAIQVLLHVGMAPVWALAAGAIFPALEIVIEIVETKHVGAIALISLTGIVTGLALAFITGNGMFAILKDSAFTFVFGAVFLGSLLRAHPLIYTLNLERAGNDRAARDRAIAFGETPAGRRSYRLLTIVWGVGLILEALVRVAVTLSVPLATAAALSPVISVTGIGALFLWTMSYARKRRAAAQPEPAT